MDPATEDFMARLDETIAAHRVARWADIRELMVDP